MVALATVGRLKANPQKTHAGRVMCDKHMITVWNNSSTACWHCPKCRRGLGSTYSCGDVLKSPPTKPIKCERCKRGYTFSSRRSTDMCNRCTICQTNRIVVHKCTRRNDTICGGCAKDFYEYEDDFMKTCQKCSRCCDDGKDRREKECIRQGLPSNQVCSYLDAGKRCRRRKQRYYSEGTNLTLPSNTKTPAVTSNSTQASTLHVQEADNFADGKENKGIEVGRPKTPTAFIRIKNNVNVHNNINVAGSRSEPAISPAAAIVVPIASVVGIVIAVIVLAGLGFWFWHKKKKPKPESSSENTSRGQAIELNSMGNGEEKGLLDDRSSQASPSGNGPRNVEVPAQENIPSNNCSRQQTAAAKPSSTVGEYLADKNKRDYDKICEPMNDPRTPRYLQNFGFIGEDLGMDSLDVHHILRSDEKEDGAFQQMLNVLHAKMYPPVTLERIAQAVEKRGYDTVARLLRDEDERLQRQKAETDESDGQPRTDDTG